MRRRWPEHCCPERHREDAAAQRALRGPSDASTHRNAAAGISQLSYSARRVVSRVLGFRARRGVRDGRRTRGVGAIFFSVLFFGLQTAPNRHKGNPARAPAGPTATLDRVSVSPDRSIAPPGFRWRRAGPGDPNSDRIGGTSVVPRGRRIHARAARTTAYRAACGQQPCATVRVPVRDVREARGPGGAVAVGPTRTHANSRELA